MKKQITLISIICLSLVFIGNSFAAGQQQPPASVKVSKVKKQEVAENRSFIGLLFYDKTSQLSSEVSGLVTRVKFKEGSRIKKGTVMATLDTQLLDKDILLKQTAIQQIDLKIEHSEKNLNRLKELFQKEAASERDYENIYYDYQDLANQKAAAKAELDKLHIQKRKSVIRAPFDGVVLEKKIDVGDWLQQGSSIGRLGSTNDLYARVALSENLLRFLKVDEKVNLTINAFQKKLTGTITSIDSVADAKTKNVFLKVKVPFNKYVAVNMSATVFVPVSEKKQLAIIPREALIKFQGKDFVYTVKDGKATILPVNIVTYLKGAVGADNPYFIPGMPIVIEGNERLRPDQAVVISGDK